MRHPHAPALVLCLAFLAGCAAREFADPVAKMTDRNTDTGTRMAAARQAEAQFTDDPARIAALHRLVWDRGYAFEDRRYAIDQLLALDEADFRAKLAHRIVLIQSYDTLLYILDLAVKRGWRDFTPVAVRSYAVRWKGTPDSERPERATIEQLNPGRPLEEVVFEVFANTDDKIPAVQQVGAWELLARLCDSEKLIGYLNAAPATNPLVVDLKAAAADLHALPRNREGVLWLQHLRDPARSAYWDAAKARVAQLTAEQRAGLELRHLPALLRADDATLAMSRAALLAQVRSRAKGDHHLTGPSFDGPMRDWPQRLHEAEPRLVWADLLVIRLVLDAIGQPHVVEQVFTQRDADVKDTTTELGGVLEETGGRYDARLFQPLVRKHDRTYVPRQEMIERMYTAIAHYHLHAQEIHNSEYAGPGRGDLELADRLNPNGVVFTSIDRDRINVDFYRPGGVVVDLGTIRR